MGAEIGILLALTAMLGWGIGDFLIQKTVRKIGTWETLLLLTFFGTIVLTPFILQSLQPLPSLDILLLFAVSFALLLGAILDFQALDQGKITAIAPLLALEIPVAVFLAYLFLGETLTLTQILLTTAIFTGLVLTILRPQKLSKTLLEKGTLIGLTGAVFLGLSNFLIGLTSRAAGPFLTTWFYNTAIMLICLTYLHHTDRLKGLIDRVMQDKKLMASVSILDNGAWIAFALALTTAPMGLVIPISGGFIAVAALLGLWINKEKLLTHQLLGVGLTFTSVTLLATITF